MTVDNYTKAGSRYSDGPITVVPSHMKKTTRDIISTTILKVTKISTNKISPDVKI